jgi:hypothetical protein
MLAQLLDHPWAIRSSVVASVIGGVLAVGGCAWDRFKEAGGLGVLLSLSFVAAAALMIFGALTLVLEVAYARGWILQHQTRAGGTQMRTTPEPSAPALALVADL